MTGQGGVVSASARVTDVISGTTLCLKRCNLSLYFQCCGTQSCVPLAPFTWVGPSSPSADGAHTTHGAAEPEASSTNVLRWDCRSLTLKPCNSPGSDQSGFFLGFL